MQSKFLVLVQFFHKWCSSGFGIFLLKLAYENLTLTHRNYGTSFFFYPLVSIKLIGYFAFLVALQACLCGSLLTIYEAVLSSVYLSKRLDRLRDRVFQFFTSSRSQASQKRLTRKIGQLCKDYNRVLRSQKEINGHFAVTLDFVMMLLVYFLVWPALLIFEPRPGEKIVQMVFFVNNYLIVIVSIALIFYYNSIFLGSNRTFLQSLLFIRKFADLKSSVALMNIHLLNPETTSLSFNYRHLCNFTSKFLFYASIELFWASSESALYVPFRIQKAI